MHIDKERMYAIAHRIADRDLAQRQRTRTRQEYETIFDVEPTPRNGREHLDLIFARVIQARATPLSAEEYQNVSEQVSLADIVNKSTHQDAFDALRAEQHIGQKIANEILRHVVDIFGIRRDEWGEDLHVALDTHIVQALRKTGAIVLEDSEQNRDPDRIINMDPNSDPRKLIAYQDVQQMFRDAASDAGFAPIVFDELWIEHREFISDPLLQNRSKFYDLIQDQYKY